MKYRFFGALILSGLLVIGFRASSQNQTQTPQSTRLSQNELNQLAKSLATNGPHQYFYVLYTVDNKKAAKADKPRIVRGLFMMRRPEFIKPLHNGFFDDRHGNLIYIGRFKSDLKHDVGYSITFAASGDVIASFDTNNDGLVDGMIGRSPSGQFWGLSDNAQLALRECFEGREFGEATLCVRRGGATRPDAGGGTAPGARGRTTSDPADDPDSLPALIHGLSNPDCDKAPTPGGTVRDDSETQKAVGRERLDVMLQRSSVLIEEERQRAAGHDDAARDCKAASDHLENADRALGVYESTSNGARREAALDTYNDELEAAQESMRSAAHDGGRDIRIHTAPPILSRDRTWRSGGGGPRIGSSTRKTPMPDETEDPRCALRQGEIKQGFWFMDRKFCPDRNFLDCWERSTDAIRDATHGRCHTETGPADSRVVVCEKEEERAAEPRDPDSPSGPGDSPVRFPIRPGPRVDYNLPVPAPFGALLAVFCQADRCGMEGLKEAKPPIRP